MSDESPLYVKIPAQLHHLAKEDERTIKELTAEGLEHAIGVTAEDSTAVIDRQIRRLENDLEEEIQALELQEERVESIRERLERKREIRDRVAEEREEYESRLDAILECMGDPMASPTRVWPSHPDIQELARGYDKNAQEVHYDLKQRAAEQERDLTIDMFREKPARQDDSDDTPISEAFDLDDGEE